MSKKVSFWGGVLAIVLALSVIGSYYYGAPAVLMLLGSVSGFTAWLVLFLASLVSLFAGVVLSLISLIDRDFSYFTSRVSLSVILVAVGFFFGNLSSLIPQGAPSFAVVLSYDSLWPVFWVPYLCSYPLSFLFEMLLVSSEKPPKRGKKKEKENLWDY